VPTVTLYTTSTGYSTEYSSQQVTAVYTPYITSWFEIRSVFKERWVTAIVYLTSNLDTGSIISSQIIPTSYLLTRYLVWLSTYLVSVWETGETKLSGSSTGSSV